MKEAEEHVNLLRAQMAPLCNSVWWARTRVITRSVRGGEAAHARARKEHKSREERLGDPEARVCVCVCVCVRVCVWLNSHADVSVCVVKLHLGARLDPAHHPCLVAGQWGHHNARRGFEVGRLVPQHYGRVLLDDGGAVVDGGGQVVHHDVLPFDARLVTGDALDAAHGCAGKGDGQEQPGEPARPGEPHCWLGLDQDQHYEAVHQMTL